MWTTVFWTVLAAGLVRGRLNVLHKWRTIDFDYPDPAMRENHIRNGDYVPGTNGLPLDVDVYYQGDYDPRIFLTFPKFRRGVPATLGTISSRGGGVDNDSPLIRPYPDWSWHSPSNCDGLTSAFRTQIDKCGRLWVVDSGVVDLASGFSRRLKRAASSPSCPRRKRKCSYSDCRERLHLYFSVGMALTPEEKDRQLYYHSLASVRESWVPTSLLRDENYLETHPVEASKRFRTSDEARKSQSVAQAFDRNGVLYFGTMDNTLNCWNSKKKFARENIHEIAKDNVNLQFASGLKVIVNPRDREEIWMVTNRFQITMVGSLDPNEINYRILKGNVDDLLKSTQCKLENSFLFPNTTTGYRPSSLFSSSSSSSISGYGR